LKRGVFSDYSRGEVPKALLLHVGVYDRYLQCAGKLLLIVAAWGFIVGKAALVEVCPNYQRGPLDLNTCFAACPYNVAYSAFNYWAQLLLVQRIQCRKLLES
jgi:hypothetical protein